MLTKTDFSVFGISNAFFLLDNYIIEKPCETSGIKFPSVRHVVLSHKVNSMAQKQQIAKTILPADLKDFEITLSKPDYWTEEYILKKLYYWTLYKFKMNTDLGIALKNTGDIELIDNLNDFYGIEELKDIKNYRGNILMDVRRTL